VSKEANDDKRALMAFRQHSQKINLSPGFFRRPGFFIFSGQQAPGALEKRFGR